MWIQSIWIIIEFIRSNKINGFMNFRREIYERHMSDVNTIFMFNHRPIIIIDASKQNEHTEYTCDYVRSFDSLIRILEGEA